MRKSVLFLFVILIVFSISCKKEDPDPIEDIYIPEGYSLLWNDEFNETSIDTDNWNYETGDGTDYGLPAGWGNNEKQIYTDNSDNSKIITDGDMSVLSITAKEDGSGGYTSAKLTTQNLLSIRFGRIDVKAKMPEGQGIWPAIWMLGNNKNIIDWPGCGEIDIAELLGHQTSTLYSTIHYTNADKEHGEIQAIKELQSSSFSSDYHLFTLEWTPENLKFLLDETLIDQIAIEEDMKEFLRSFYFILNVAVGGYWPGDPDETTDFPQSMLIDYIRVYSKDGLQIPLEPELNIDEETVGQDINPNIGDHAIKDDFTDLGNITVIVYGGGGEPFISESETCIDGTHSLVYEFPGGAWGGAYIELESAKNLSTYNYLKFSLNKPTALIDAEIKLESSATDASIYLSDYTSVSVANGFEEYTIPLTDFAGLDLIALTIAFSIWNPTDLNQDFVTANVLIDNVYFSL